MGSWLPNEGFVQGSLHGTGAGPIGQSRPRGVFQPRVVDGVQAAGHVENMPQRDLRPGVRLGLRGRLLGFLFGLLELGTVAAGRMRDMKQAGWRLVALGCFLPTVHGIIGTAGGIFAGMSIGGAAVLGAMVGSASYIAAPAAVRIALPKASPGIYLTLALGITFPFNLIVGIPLFLKVAEWLSYIQS